MQPHPATIVRTARLLPVGALLLGLASGGAGFLAGCRSTPDAAPAPATAPDGIARGTARAELEAGNARFVGNRTEAHNWSTERTVKTGTFGQTPSVGILSCADSRVPVEMIFDQGVGDLFVVRVAGNSESTVAAGTFEYGVAALGVHTILVLGHTKCGAVTAAMEGKPLPGNMGSFTEVIEPAFAAGRPADGDAATLANARWQASALLERSEMLRKAVADGSVEMLLGIYDVDTGRVRFVD
ncbi:MAG: hypothetical protein RIS86_1471 [Planctomycetota bacterium]